MAPKKPKKKNAFMIFCSIYRNQQNSRNGLNLSLKEAIDLAGPLWSKMSERERQKYKDKANSTAAATKNPADIQAEKEEQETKKCEKKVFDTVSTSVHCMAAVGSLQHFNICIFHVNTFCYDEKRKRHYPAEVAVVKFNLQDGVWDYYHALCTPGPFPLGYASIIQKKSDNTHQIPVPDPRAPNNLEKTFHEMVAFVDDRRRNKPPPLYVPPDNYTEAKEFLATLCTDFGYDPLYLEVCSLSHLFYEMRNAAAGKEVFHSESLAVKELERDTYEFAPGICCSVHDALGVPYKCSKSVVTRMAYIICDNCCRDLKIDLIPGKHLPAPLKPPTPPPPVTNASHTENEVQIKVEKDDSESDSDSDGDDASFSSEESKVDAASLNFADNEPKVDISTLDPSSYEEDDYMFL